MNQEERSTYLILSIILLISFMGIIFITFPGTNITGFVTFDELEKEKEGFVYESPEVITQEVALDALLKAEQDLQEMNDFNINIDFFKDTLSQAKRYYVGVDFSIFREESQKIDDALKQDYIRDKLVQIFSITPEYEKVKTDYSEVIRLTQLIAFKKGQAYGILDTLSILEEEENNTDSGVDTSEVKELLDNARKAFEEGRYDEAEGLLEDADLKLDLSLLEYQRSKGLIKLSKNFFQKYWWQIILVIIILVIIAKPIIKKVRKKLAKKKLETLRLELQTISKLIKKAQEECFKDKKITVDTYKTRVDKYKTRMAEIKHTIPVLESIVSRRNKKKKAKKKGILEIKK